MNAIQIAMKIKELRVSGFIESANKWETCEPDGLNGDKESGEWLSALAVPVHSSASSSK
jgi:hypothetical protein